MKLCAEELFYLIIFASIGLLSGLLLAVPNIPVR